LDENKLRKDNALGLINEFRFEIKLEKVSEICYVCEFWLYVASAYNLVLA